MLASVSLIGHQISNGAGAYSVMPLQPPLALHVFPSFHVTRKEENLSGQEEASPRTSKTTGSYFLVATGEERMITATNSEGKAKLLKASFSERN
uniref:Uncharacterized protein n=1 Tax=Oryza meridionalis TaxID=40149 RepID=A0A0E0DM20_9ORYZ